MSGAPMHSSYEAHAQAARDIEAYLHRHNHKSLLRFITCGSVDDGKSTLIGRLLYDSRMIFEDQLAALAADSKRIGTQGQNIDFALLVDGLAAEREQGITIDVAYRFFATERRKFIVADTPGHEQYTRNMVTGASTADLAVILIDARKSPSGQTRPNGYLVALLSIRQIQGAPRREPIRRAQGPADSDALSQLLSQLARHPPVTFGGEQPAFGGLFGK